MQPESRRDRIVDWAWFLLWALASTSACLATAWTIGATWDEPLHIVESMEGWRSGSYQRLIRLGTMPLPLDVYTLPIYLWERWRGVPFDLTTEVDTLMPWFRVGALVFWWIALIYARLIGRRVAGPWGGRLAVALLACEPVVLAHASIGGTDIAITACTLALIYHFRVNRDADWKWRVGLPACWYAASVLAKASGFVFGPMCMVVLELEHLIRRGAFSTRICDPRQNRLIDIVRHVRAQFRPLFWDLGGIMAIGLSLVFLYCGSDWRQERSFVQWAQSLPEGPTSTVMIWFAEHLRIFPNAGEAIVRQITHNIRGHSAYILGHAHPRYFWYYFPLALTIKLSLPLLVGPLLLGLFQRRALLNWVIALVAFLLLFSLNCHVQNGVRLLLPLIALLTIGLAVSLVRAYQLSAAPRQRLLIVGASAACIAWTATAACSVWPHWLCYTNELWGGTRNGYRLLSDSNYDWGQGVPELARWQHEHGDCPMSVWYFGKDPALAKLPMRQIHADDLTFPAADAVPPELRGRYLAVGLTHRYGSYVSLGPPAARRVLHFLETHMPAARTTTFLIYDFTKESGR